MEEKRPGQSPDADRASDDPQENRSARPAGHAKDGLEPTDQDRQLIREADARATQAAVEMEREGFGHKDVKGITALDRQE